MICCPTHEVCIGWSVVVGPLSAIVVWLHLIQFAVPFVQIVTTVCLKGTWFYTLFCDTCNAWYMVSRALVWFNPLFFEQVGTRPLPPPPPPYPHPHPAIGLRKVGLLSSQSEHFRFLGKLLRPVNLFRYLPRWSSSRDFLQICTIGNTNRKIQILYETMSPWPKCLLSEICAHQQGWSLRLESLSLGCNDYIFVFVFFFFSFSFFFFDPSTPLSLPSSSVTSRAAVAKW